MLTNDGIALAPRTYTCTSPRRYHPSTPKTCRPLSCVNSVDEQVASLLYDLMFLTRSLVSQNLSSSVRPACRTAYGYLAAVGSPRLCLKGRPFSAGSSRMAVAVRHSLPYPCQKCIVILMIDTGNWADLFDVGHNSQPGAVPQPHQCGCPGRSKGGLRSPSRLTLGHF